jgi:hypothetical protein
VWPWIAIFAASLAAYWPALRGGLVWDDNAAHVTAPALQSLHGLWRIWFSLGATQQYYPLLHTAFWIEHRLWGDAVLGYHLANLTQHALAACFVVLIVRRLALPAVCAARGCAVTVMQSQLTTTEVNQSKRNWWRKLAGSRLTPRPPLPRSGNVRRS